MFFVLTVVRVHVLCCDSCSVHGLCCNSCSVHVLCCDSCSVHVLCCDSCTCTRFLLWQLYVYLFCVVTVVVYMFCVVTVVRVPVLCCDSCSLHVLCCDSCGLHVLCCDSCSVHDWCCDSCSVHVLCCDSCKHGKNLEITVRNYARTYKKETGYLCPYSPTLWTKQAPNLCSNYMLLLPSYIHCVTNPVCIGQTAVPYCMLCLRSLSFKNAASRFYHIMSGINESVGTRHW